MNQQNESAQEHPAAKLLNFARRTRHVEDADALQFMLVNETFGLANYRVSALWVAGSGILAQSGVSHVEATSPFVSWLSNICEKLSVHDKPEVVEPEMLATEDISMWEHALPATALWIPFRSNGDIKSGFFVARDESWSQFDIALLSEWIDIWAFAWRRLQSPSIKGKLIHSLSSYRASVPGKTQMSGFFRDAWIGFKFVVMNFALRPDTWLKGISTALKTLWTGFLWPFKAGWKKSFDAIFRGIKASWANKNIRYLLLAFLVVFFPVRLTVLAPAELIPFNPAVIRVPIDGVVDEFFVIPNQ